MSMMYVSNFENIKEVLLIHGSFINRKAVTDINQQRLFAEE